MAAPNAVRPSKRPLALLALRLAALWLLTGACFKLFLGTPADLPAMVRDLPLELGLTYKLAIGVELCFVVLALGAPRLGWVAIVAIYLVFGGILLKLLGSGAESCGCFGSKVTMPPERMLVIDSVLLVFLLATRPWKGTASGANKLLVGLFCVAAIALPFLFDRELKFDGQQKSAPVAKGDTAQATSTWSVLDIEHWVGQSIYDTPLAGLLEPDISTLPTDGMWVLWRWTCSHCADHLEELTRNPPDVPFLTLVRLKEKIDDEENREVFFMPSGPTVVEASLPDSVEYVITTPGELMLEGGVIVSAREGADEPAEQESNTGSGSGRGK